MSDRSKKKKRRQKRIVDAPANIDEAPGSGIEPGSGLDEYEDTEAKASTKKMSKLSDTDRKSEKTSKKASPKKPAFGSGIRKFFKDVQAEAKKIVWPDGEQQKNSTVVVVMTIIALAAFMGFFSNIFYKISNQFFMPDTGGIEENAFDDIGSVESSEDADVEGLGGEAGNGAPDDVEDPS